MGNRAVLNRWFWGVKWVCGVKVKKQRKTPVHRWLGGFGGGGGGLSHVLSCRPHGGDWISSPRDVDVDFTQCRVGMAEDESHALCICFVGAPGEGGPLCLE